MPAINSDPQTADNAPLPDAARRAAAFVVLPWSPRHVGGVTGVVQSLIEHWPPLSPIALRLLVNDWSTPTATARPDGGLYFRFDTVDASSPWRFLSSLCRAPSTLLRTAALLRRERVAAVNFHYTGLGPLGIAVLKAIGLYRGTLVISFHGTDVRPASNAVEAALRGFIFRRADHLVACSRSLGERMVSTLNMPAGKLRVVNNGADTDVFRPGASRPAGSLPDLPARYIVSIGAFIERKAHADLVRAFADLAGTHPDLHLCIAGGDGPTFSAIVEQAKAAGLSDRVHLWVGLSRNDVAHLLARAELCVQAALAESFPLAVLEAGAVGTPVAASDIPGHDELIIEGHTGRLFRVRDPDDCRRVVSDMLGDAAASRAAADRLRAHVLTSLTWEHCVRAYERLYAERPAERDEAGISTPRASAAKADR